MRMSAYWLAANDLGKGAKQLLAGENGHLGQTIHLTQLIVVI